MGIYGIALERRSQLRYSEDKHIVKEQGWVQELEGTQYRVRRALVVH